MDNIRRFLSRIQKKIELKKWLASFVSAFKQKEVIIGVSAIALICFMAWLGVYLFVGQDSATDTITVQEDVIRHPLTGEIIEEEMDDYPSVFGVMIENSYEAWPLSGLDDAFLVIEAPVEANIPRFIAFFSSDSKSEKIGPVRSARPYYLDWAEGLGALYAHVGGSPKALELIEENENFVDLNQFWNDQYFYRQNATRFAPHNVYTSLDLLIEALGENELEKYDVWKFEQGSASENPVSVFVDWTDGSTYDITWKYQDLTNDYLRYQGDEMMELEDGSVIVADNIVVLATDIRVIDNEGRREITTIGSGDALMVQNGEAYLVRWQKESAKDRLRFYTSDGYEISMNPGSTWIEIVSSLSQVKTTK